MSRLAVVHIALEDKCQTTWRMLDYMASQPELCAQADHRVEVIRPDSFSIGRIDADIIISHLPLQWRRLPALMGLRALNPSTPIVHVEHRFTEAYTDKKMPRAKRPRSLLRTSYSMFDRVVSSSMAQANWMLRYELLDHLSLHMIPFAVGLEEFRTLAPTTGRPRVIGAIGALEESRGFDMLVRAFTKLKDADLRLEIYGEGSQWDTLSKLVANDKRIVLRGTAADPVRAMSRVDAVAMPSRWEAHGQIAYEAIAARRPLVVAQIDGLIDHVAAGAIPVGQPTVEAWVEALNDLVSNEVEEVPKRDMPLPEEMFTAGWHGLLNDLASRGTDAPKMKSA